MSFRRLLSVISTAGRNLEEISMRATKILRRAKEIRQIRESGPDAIEADRMERLRRLVAHAKEHSSFYRDLYHDIDPGSFELSDLPTTNKRLLMDNFDEAVTDDRLRKEEVREWAEEASQLGQFFKGNFILANTSGTTGFKGYFAYTREEWDEVMAYMTLQVRRRSGRPGEMLLSLLPGVRSRATSVVAAGGHYIDILVAVHYPSIMKYLVRTEVINVTDPIDRMVERLNAFRPSFLSGYPTAIESLAREQLAGRLHLDLTDVNLFSELLTPECRSTIEGAFGCEAFSVYGATESFIIAKECHHKRMHLWSDLVILEPVEADGTPTPPGRPSHKVFITCLPKLAQPLIRYDLADSVVPVAEPCPCGARLPVIEVIGRTDDTFWVSGPDGRIVPLLPIAIGVQVADLKGIEQFQVRLEARDRVKVLFIPELPSEAETLGSAIVSNFEAFFDRHDLKECVSVDWEAVEEIPRTAGGKLRRIYSLIGPPDRVEE